MKIDKKTKKLLASHKEEFGVLSKKIMFVSRQMNTFFRFKKLITEDLLDSILKKKINEKD